MVKHVPQADEKSAKMGWFFDPGFIQNVQRVAADIENPFMEVPYDLFTNENAHQLHQALHHGGNRKEWVP